MHTAALLDAKKKRTLQKKKLREFKQKQKNSLINRTEFVKNILMKRRIGRVRQETAASGLHLLSFFFSFFDRGGLRGRFRSLAVVIVS
jgi:hypothetical protein